MDMDSEEGNGDNAACMERNELSFCIYRGASSVSLVCTYLTSSKLAWRCMYVASTSLVHETLVSHSIARYFKSRHITGKVVVCL